MRCFRALALALLVVSSGAVGAYSGNDLLRDASEPKTTVRYAFAAGYVQSVVDSSKHAMCLPKDATLADAVEAIRKGLLKVSVEAREWHASAWAKLAIFDAYGCKIFEDLPAVP